MNILDCVAYHPDGYLISTINNGRWKPGTRVGHPYWVGYYIVRFRGHCYYVHRLIWQLANGPIPKNRVIDHINGDTHDNRIANLRAVPRSLNQRNSKLNKRNTSGYPGISYDKRRRKWHAYIGVGKGVIQRLGHFQSLQDAIEARQAAEALHGYHSNHGRLVTLHHRLDRYKGERLCLVKSAMKTSAKASALRTLRAS